MRHIGTLPTEQLARCFDDYLLFLHIKGMVEPDGEISGGEISDGEISKGETPEDQAPWSVWIYDEDSLEMACSEFQKFRDNPAAVIYQEATQAANGIRKSQQKQQQQREKRQKKIVNVRDQWGHRPFAKRAPVTLFLILASVLLTLLSSFGKSVEPIMSTFGFAKFVPTKKPGYLAWVPPGDSEIREGQLWRLVTPAFLHLDPMHLLFNMYWVFTLGQMIEMRRGSWRLILLTLLFAVISNYFQFLMKDPAFGGMSGVIYGFFGYIWMKSRFAPEEGMLLHPQTIFMMVGWFFLCMTDVFGGSIGNWSHGSGLVMGMLLGYAPIFFRDLQRR